MANYQIIEVKIPFTTGNYAEKLFRLVNTIKSAIDVYVIEWGSTVLDASCTNKIHINLDHQTDFQDRHVATTKWSVHQLLTVDPDVKYPIKEVLPIPITLKTDFYIGIKPADYASNGTFYINLYYLPSNEKLEKRL